jgi:hypothetical protein
MSRMYDTLTLPKYGHNYITKTAVVTGESGHESLAHECESQA